MEKEFTIDQIKDFVKKDYQSVAARMTKCLLKYYEEEHSKRFNQGYTAAVCVDIQNHGMRTEVCDMWKCNRMTVEEMKENGIPDHDIDLLKTHWKELNR